VESAISIPVSTDLGDVDLASSMRIPPELQARVKQDAAYAVKVMKEMTTGSGEISYKNFFQTLSEGTDVAGDAVRREMKRGGVIYNL
jgi:hypothetical protein